MISLRVFLGLADAADARDTYSHIAQTLRMLLCPLLFLSSGYAIATVTRITDPSRCLESHAGCWEISGVISEADHQEVKAIADRLVATTRTLFLPTLFFYLNSEGGDIEAAIGIGRQLRRIGATTLMWEGAQCVSACVFVLAGATRRILAGRIGIHRPYSVRTDQRRYDAIQQDQRRLAKLAKDYLEDVNVSPSLYDAMVRIPPEKMRLLSRADLDLYGITDVDMVEQELEDASEARKYGLPKTEYLRRKAQVNVTCAREHRRGKTLGDFDSYFSCRDKVLRAAQ